MASANADGGILVTTVQQQWYGRSENKVSAQTLEASFLIRCGTSIVAQMKERLNHNSDVHYGVL
jgi:hypothetical protein